jgi:hypothetical protein
MTPEQITIAEQDMRTYLSFFPLSSLTKLAEYAANEQSHDEWLDDPAHEIWDIALEIRHE